jgi:DNA-directed RNA polymerase specialized sigma24 family protein
MEDPTGVVGFCQRVQPRLVGTLSLLCGDGEAGEELAQETLARVWLRWGRVRELDEALAVAWTYRVGINLANSWGRRRVAERRARARLAAPGAGAYVDPDPADGVAVRQAAAALPRRQRTALVLRYYADLPVAEVAGLMGCAPGTVKSPTSKALEAMRRVEGMQVAEEVTDGP